MTKNDLNAPEMMTRFDKFVLKAVGSLLVIGIVTVGGTMMKMNMSLVKMESELKYVSEKIQEANKDRYSASMASVDKSLLNSKIEVNSNHISEIERKISVIFKKLSAAEKDILILQK